MPWFWTRCDPDSSGPALLSSATASAAHQQHPFVLRVPVTTQNSSKLHGEGGKCWKCMKNDWTCTSTLGNKEPLDQTKNVFDILIVRSCTIETNDRMRIRTHPWPMSRSLDRPLWRSPRPGNAALAQRHTLGIGKEGPNSSHWCTPSSADTRSLTSKILDGHFCCSGAFCLSLLALCFYVSFCDTGVPVCYNMLQPRCIGFCVWLSFHSPLSVFRLFTLVSFHLLSLLWTFYRPQATAGTLVT